MPDQEFINLVKNIIFNQSSHSATGHPDKSIRSFNDAFLQLFETDTKTQNYIQKIHKERYNLNPDHLVFLLSRSTQYILRNQKVTDYTQYSIQDWKNVITELLDNDLYFQLLTTKHNSSTQPRLRYRSLAALLSLIQKKSNIIDLGCSLNLGLTCLLKKNINCENLEDFTPDSQICREIRKNKNKLIKIPPIGIDIIDPQKDIDWTKACEYFNNYEKHGQELDIDINSRNQLVSANKLRFVQTDITKNQINENQISSTDLNIIHTSMFLYQLTEIEKNNLLDHLSLILNEGDILIELSPHNFDSWFSKKNITTTIRFVKNHNFSPKYEWLIWDSPRCKKIWPGQDYDLVIQSLLNKSIPQIRQTYDS